MPSKSNEKQVGLPELPSQSLEQILGSEGYLKGWLTAIRSRAIAIKEAIETRKDKKEYFEYLETTLFKVIDETLKRLPNKPKIPEEETLEYKLQNNMSLFRVKFGDGEEEPGSCHVVAVSMEEATKRVQQEVMQKGERVLNVWELDSYAVVALPK
jgi:hypothetical protein